jgi:hypothetical protein
MRDNKIAEALHIVCTTGVVSAYLISARLRIGIQEAVALIGALLSHGYLSSMKVESCGSCPLRSICPYAGKAEPREIYYLTERGREACRKIGKQ